MDDIKRADVRVGLEVDILTEDNRTVRGFINHIYPGKKKQVDIDVALYSGEMGVVSHIVTQEEKARDTFRFYNLFFYSRYMVTIMHKQNQDVFLDRIQYSGRDDYERVAYLFSDEKKALTFLLKRGNDDLAIKRVSRKKPLVENFKKQPIDYFYLDDERKVTPSRLDENERTFQSMG